MLAAYEPDLPGIKIFSDSVQIARQRLHQTGLDLIFEDVTSILVAHEIFHHLEYTHRVTSSLSEVSAHSFAQAFCHLKQSPILINYLLMLKENDLPNQQNIQETSQWLQKKLAKAG